MNVAVFADVHGRILLAFKLCRRWEQETGGQIDLILQAGDLGVFSSPDRLDRATRRFAERDPTELGFMEYFAEPSSEVEQVLAEVQADMVFVRGNHEDHAFLDELEGHSPEEEPLFPVDCYQRVFCLRSGAVFACRQGEQMLRVLGVGRIGDPAGKPKYIQPYEEERALSQVPGCCDVLLTHDSARDFVTPGFGSVLIRHLVHQLKPTYHLFGHIGRPFPVQSYPGSPTVAVKVADLEWTAPGSGAPLQTGAMGILHWEGQECHEFTSVEPWWWREYTIHSWKHL